MLQRIKGEIVFICDNCEEFLETGVDDIYEANALRRQAGWQAQQFDGWSHFCKTCVDRGV